MCVVVCLHQHSEITHTSSCVFNVEIICDVCLPGVYSIIAIIVSLKYKQYIYIYIFLSCTWTNDFLYATHIDKSIKSANYINLFVFAILSK